jgi:hypothetical protein
MLGKTRALGKCNPAKSWQAACNQSNAAFTQRACQSPRRTRKFLTALTSGAFILWTSLWAQGALAVCSRGAGEV